MYDNDISLFAVNALTIVIIIAVVCFLFVVMVCFVCCCCCIWCARRRKRYSMSNSKCFSMRGFVLASGNRNILVAIMCL